MRKIVFPPVETATEDGLVAIGGDLETDTLTEAYRRGIFPWPISLDFPLAWFSPDPRGVIELSELHVPRSLQKVLNKNPYQVSFNHAFAEVIRQCARVRRRGQDSTWITPEIISGYNRLFDQNLAYSVEVWSGDQLVGGMYGVSMGNFHSGESMFSIAPNASKVGLIHLLRRLEERGIGWLDTQMVTPVVESLGGKYVSRQEFMGRLALLDWRRKRESIFE